MFYVLKFVLLLTLAFVLWPVYRIARKAGYLKRHALLLCAACVGCNVLGQIAVDYLISGGPLFWVYRETQLELVDLAYLVGIVQRTFSVAIMSALPILFFSFLRWPVERREEDAGVFE